MLVCVFRGSGLVLLRNLYFCDFSEGRGSNPLPPRDSPMICTCSPEPWMLDNAIGTTISYAGSAHITVCYIHLFVLFDLILHVSSTIFQLYREGFFWVEPVLS